MLLLISQLLQLPPYKVTKDPEYLYVFHKFDQDKLENINVPRFEEIQKLQTFLRTYLD